MREIEYHRHPVTLGDWIAIKHFYETGDPASIAMLILGRTNLSMDEVAHLSLSDLKDVSLGIAKVLEELLTVEAVERMLRGE